jgi:hypothetical protein
MLARLHTKLLATLFVCTTGILISGDSALCVGPNGHVALEQIGAYCCSGSKRVFGTVVPASASASVVSRLEGCADCTDTELSDIIPAAKQESDVALTPPASPVAAAHWPPSTGGAVVLALLNPDRLPRSDLCLIFARTISLRC